MLWLFSFLFRNHSFVEGFGIGNFSWIWFSNIWKSINRIYDLIQVLWPPFAKIIFEPYSRLLPSNFQLYDCKWWGFPSNHLHDVIYWTTVNLEVKKLIEFFRALLPSCWPRVSPLPRPPVFPVCWLWLAVFSWL